MAHSTFPNGVDFGISEGRKRFDEFERVLMHNWSTYISNPTMWYVLIESIPIGLRNLNRGNILNMEGPNAYEQMNSNNTDLINVLTNGVGCMVVHGVRLPEMSVEMSRGDEKLSMGGYYGGLIGGQVQEQTNLTIEFRETHSSVPDLIIRPWLELCAKNGAIARPAGDIRNVKTRITIMHLGIASATTDPITRKVWTFNNCMPMRVGNQSLAHDGTWSASDMYIDTDWVYSDYKIEDVQFANVSQMFTKHIENPEAQKAATEGGALIPAPPAGPSG